MSQDNLVDTKPRVSPPPWKLEVRSSRKFVISVVSMAIFTDSFIYGMVVPILPTVLRTRVSVPDDDLQRWMSILLAAFGGAIFLGSPTFGYFADKSASRQGPFIIGLLALAGSTVMFWVATTLMSLVIARILQGLSAAVVWTVGMALVIDTVGKDQVGSAMGYVSMSMTLGTVFGPFIGGAVLSRLGYHAVFVIAIALIAFDIVLRLFMIEQKTAAKWTVPLASNGEAEGLLNSGGSNSRYHAIDQSPQTQPPIEAPDSVVASPDGDLDPFSNGRTSPVPAIVRLMCSGGMLVALAATVVDAMIWSSFDTLVSKNTTQDQILLFVFLFVAGFATTLQMVALMTEVSYGVERLEKERPGIFGQQGGVAQAYGLFNVAWSGGQVVGPLVAGLLVDLGGWTVMVVVFGVLSGVTALMVLQSDPSILRRLGGRQP
ncbi:hypothetical protein FE257_001615 [Aspergillus nanangensis]|uniref:Major facilitator superfamily (MFS) profile domain-containing protein n=1 Tax=Aspergillus nanangensis TaxID=2582783 RepID=A0AAD4CTZ4_ASPNN|nr:hypothetical protein FE257_001615 [Aspergillus nanangensis]